MFVTNGHGCERVEVEKSEENEIRIVTTKSRRRR
jgi:hypothetical protein